jgi:heme A synthase
LAHPTDLVVITQDPKWRNFTENDVTVQFQHRVLGITTFSSIVAMWLWSRKVTPSRLLNAFS